MATDEGNTLKGMKDLVMKNYAKRLEEMLHSKPLSCRVCHKSPEFKGILQAISGGEEFKYPEKELCSDACVKKANSPLYKALTRE